MKMKKKKKTVAARRTCFILWTTEISGDCMRIPQMIPDVNNEVNITPPIHFQQILQLNATGYTKMLKIDGRPGTDIVCDGKSYAF